jgi:hypothetical protein
VTTMDQTREGRLHGWRMGERMEGMRVAGCSDRGEQNGSMTQCRRGGTADKWAICWTAKSRLGLGMWQNDSVCGTRSVCR